MTSLGAAHPEAGLNDNLSLGASGDPKALARDQREGALILRSTLPLRDLWSDNPTRCRWFQARRRYSRHVGRLVSKGC
jgi:hypothetical protein